MRLRKLLPVALFVVLPALPGCFAFDEIDSGLEEMQTRSANRKANEHSLENTHPGAAPHQPEAAPAATPGGSASALAASVQASVREWWGNARSIAPGADVDDGVVACQLDGRTAFMLEDDCIGRGGRTGS